MSIEELVAVHAKTKVGHLSRQVHTQREFIKALEQEKAVLEAEIVHLKRQLAGKSGALTRLKRSVAATMASAMGVASIIHPDFIPL